MKSTPGASSIRRFCTGVAAVVLAAAVPATAVARPAPSPTPSKTAKTATADVRLARVAQRVVELADRIDKAKERVAAKRSAAESARGELSALQGRQEELRAQISSINTQVAQVASEQYRSAGLPPTLEFALHGTESAEYLHMKAVYRKVMAQHQAVTKAYTANHREMQSVLAKAETDIRRLAAEEAAAVRETAALEAAAAESARLLAGLDVGPDPAVLPDHAAGSAARAALRFAVAQIGRPYVWGAVGPDSYDCSGLTSRAWLAAGVAIPRTSQEQWAALPKVPLGELRPGDLVVYFPGATHIGIYAGGGTVIHAPRPGRRVTTAPMSALPILGAVRPVPAPR